MTKHIKSFRNHIISIEISLSNDYSVLSYIKTSLRTAKNILCKDKLSSSDTKTT